MKLFDVNALLDTLQHHLDCTYMSVCSSVEECKAKRDEIQYIIELVKEQPPVEVKLRTNEDILTADEAIATINRLRKAYRENQECGSGCFWCSGDIPLKTKINDVPVNTNYCPMCGVKMSTK